MKRIVTLIILGMSISNVMAETASHPGKVLHDEKCLRCHGSEVYTREQRMAPSLYALDKQVRNCMKGPADANWNDTETAQVIDYLNQSFYHFEDKQ